MEIKKKIVEWVDKFTNEGVSTFTELATNLSKIAEERNLEVIDTPVMRIERRSFAMKHHESSQKLKQEKIVRQSEDERERAGIRFDKEY